MFAFQWVDMVYVSCLNTNTRDYMTSLGGNIMDWKSSYSSFVKM